MSDKGHLVSLSRKLLFLGQHTEVPSLRDYRGCREFGGN